MRQTLSSHYNLLRYSDYSNFNHIVNTKNRQNFHYELYLILSSIGTNLSFVSHYLQSILSNVQFRMFFTNNKELSALLQTNSKTANSHH